jgi:hypothetical protein
LQLLWKVMVAKLQHWQLPGLKPQTHSVAALLLLLLQVSCQRCLLLLVLQKGQK